MEAIQYITDTNGNKTGLFFNFQHPQTPDVLKKTLTNLQTELLELYARNIPDEYLKDIKQLIAEYFAEKATSEADKVWAEKNYNEDELLNMHLRTPYKTEKK